MKNHTLSILGSVLLATMFVGTPAAIAATKEPPRPKNRVLIESVSDSSITIKSLNGTKTYTVVPDGVNKTKVTLRGADSTTSALQKGMRVSVTEGMTLGIATRIDADDPPKEKPKAAKVK